MSSAAIIVLMVMIALLDGKLIVTNQRLSSRVFAISRRFMTHHAALQLAHLHQPKDTILEALLDMERSIRHQQSAAAIEFAANQTALDRAAAVLIADRDHVAIELAADRANLTSLQTYLSQVDRQIDAIADVNAAADAVADAPHVNWARSDLAVVRRLVRLLSFDAALATMTRSRSLAALPIDPLAIKLVTSLLQSGARSSNKGGSRSGIVNLLNQIERQIGTLRAAIATNDAAAVNPTDQDGALLAERDRIESVVGEVTAAIEHHVNAICLLNEQIAPIEAMKARQDRSYRADMHDRYADLESLELALAFATSNVAGMTPSRLCHIRTPTCYRCLYDGHCQQGAVCTDDGVCSAPPSIAPSTDADAGRSTPGASATTPAPTPGEPLATNVSSRVPEDAVMHVQCPPGQYVVAIQFASYGTPTEAGGDFAASLCHSTESETMVSNYCLQRSSCEVAATDRVFGNPCAGVVKRLYATLICQEPFVSSVMMHDDASDNVYDVVAEDLTLTLTCPVGGVVFKVKFASFGQPTGGTNGEFDESPSCHSPTSMSVINTLCLGRSTCSVQATSDLFDNPCPGSSKRLAVQVLCRSSAAMQAQAIRDDAINADAVIVGQPIVIEPAPTDDDGVEGLNGVWKEIREHPAVSLTIGCGIVSIVLLLLYQCIKRRVLQRLFASRHKAVAATIDQADQVDVHINEHEVELDTDRTDRTRSSEQNESDDDRHVSPDDSGTDNDGDLEDDPLLKPLVPKGVVHHTEMTSGVRSLPIEISGSGRRSSFTNQPDAAVVPLSSDDDRRSMEDPIPAAASSIDLLPTAFGLSGAAQGATFAAAGSGPADLDPALPIPSSSPVEPLISVDPIAAPPVHLLSAGSDGATIGVNLLDADLNPTAVGAAIEPLDAPLVGTRLTSGLGFEFEPDSDEDLVNPSARKLGALNYDSDESMEDDKKDADHAEVQISEEDPMKLLQKWKHVRRMTNTDILKVAEGPTMFANVLDDAISEKAPEVKTGVLKKLINKVAAQTDDSPISDLGLTNRDDIESVLGTSTTNPSYS